MKNENIADWLNKLGSKTPTPGGGAVGALNGAIASAQLKMVCEYTKDDSVNGNADYFAKIADNFISLAEEDSQAYLKIREAYQTKDAEQINQASVSAVAVSSKIIKASEEIVKFVENNLGKFNKNFNPDLIVVLANIKASVRSSSAMIRANIGSLTEASDQQASSQTLKDSKKILFETSQLIDKLEES